MSKHAALVLLLGLAAASLAAVAALHLLGGAGSLESLAVRSRTWVTQNAVAALILFTLWAFAANLLVLPFGTLSLLIAGGLVTPVIPATIWWVAQCATAPIIHCIGARSLSPDRIDRLIGTALPSLSVERLRQAAGRHALETSALLRLAPFLPSAPAALLAAAIGLPSTIFLLATALFGWIRPLYFAGLGSGIGELAAPSLALTPVTLAPLAGVFLLALASVGARAWLVWRATGTPLPTRPDNP